MASLRKWFCCIATSLLLSVGLNILQVYGQDSSLENLLEKALTLQSDAQYEQSSDLLRQAIPGFKDLKNWSELGQCYNELSFNARSQNKLEEAEKYAREVLALHESHEDFPASELATAYKYLGIIETERSNYDQALDWLQKGLSVSEQSAISTPLTASLIANIGSVYHEQGKYDQAMGEYRKGIDLLEVDNPNHQKQLVTLYNYIGINYVSKGAYDKALSYYQKELDLSLQVYGKGHPNVAGVYNNLGGISYRSGDIGTAIDYFKKAAQSFQKAYGSSHPNVGMTYNNIGAGYFQLGNLQQSIAYLEKSAEITKQVRGPGHPEVAIRYNNIGGLYLELDEYDKAKTYLQRSLRIRKEALGENHPDLTNTYSSLGNLFLELQQPDSAITYFQREVDITQKQRGEQHPYVADALNNIARSYANQEFYERALSHHQQALQVLGGNFKSERYARNPAIEEIRYPSYVVNVLYRKGQTLQSYFEESNQLGILEAGLATFMRLSDLLDYMQAGFESEESKLLMSRQSHEMYEHGIQTAHQLYQETGDSKYLNRAFYFAEKSKTRVILELIKTQQAKEFAGIPDSLLSYENNLRDQLTQVHQELNNSIDASGENAKTRKLRDSLFALNRSLDGHLQFLENEYPRYHNLKYNQDIPEVSAIQKKLKQENLSLIEYFTGASSTWAFVMDGQNLEVTTLPHDSSLARNVDQFRQAIAQEADSTYFKLGSRLYNNLVAPIIDHVESSNTLIVPDGALNLLPFEALLTREIAESEDNVSFSQLPYLMNEFTISYSPSTSLSNMFYGDENQRYDARFAAFAPVFNFSESPIKTRNAGPGAGWSPLPLTKQEVQEISDVLQGEKGFWDMLFGSSEKSKLYLENEATEKAFKSADLSDYEFLHLATHAFAADTGSYRSGIVFHQSSGDSEDDILYAEEIYTLQLQSKLLVLSACETGMGEVVKGEGIIGLSRAFQYAGVKNLLVSLWKVDDRSTSRLMIDFYRHHIDGDSFTNALRSAKEDLINNPTYAHPKYWAPFVFIGN